MPFSTDPESQAQRGSRKRLDEGPEHLERWRTQTPLVLQRAIKACWDGTGTPAQKLLLSEWVTARVMHKPIPVSALRAALLAERMEERKVEWDSTKETLSA